MTDFRVTPPSQFSFGIAALWAFAGQTVFGIIAVTMLYSSLVNTANNTKATADTLTMVVAKQTERQQKFSDRLVQVETTMDYIKVTVQRIDNKIDTLRK